MVLDSCIWVALAAGQLAVQDAIEIAGERPLTRTTLQRFWIAVQAMENSYALLTLNVGDFRDLPELQVLTPVRA